MDTQSIIELVLQILAVVGGSAVISAAIPPKYKGVIPVVGKVLEVLAANVGNAKNKDAD